MGERELALGAAGARASAADRERVAERLREACADERLSLDTFLVRVETAYTAQTRAELAPLVADLRAPGRLSRAVFAALTHTSRWVDEAREAWRRGPAEALVLPREGRVVVGRSRACDVVVASEFVSRRHALLRSEAGRWSLEDCGSRNGTWVNGRRIRGAVNVGPGDAVTLADASYVLVRPRPQA